MIILHKPTATNFDNNGKAILSGAIVRSELTHKINRACIVTIELLKGDPKLGQVEKEDILTCPTPFGVQPFRIFDINPLGLDRVEIVARHVFFDLQKRVVKRCKVDNFNGQASLTKYLTCLDKTVPHKLYSDITELASFDWQLKQGVDVLLGDEDNSFINKYGFGELQVDGFNAWINKRIGRDRGFTALFRKNITGFTGKTSTDGLITRIIPKGFDGITLYEEAHVDSLLVGKYADIYTKVVEFPDVKWKDSPNNYNKEGFETITEARTELKKRATQYFIDTECDVINASFNINLIMLKDTIEYKDIAVSEELQLGDTITVDYEPYKIEMKKRLVGYTYNPETEKFINLEIGDFNKDFFQTINDKIDKLPDKEQIKEDVNNSISGKLDEFTNELITGGNGSFVKFKPNFQNPSEILIMDNEDEAKAVKVIRLNKEGIGASITGVTGTYSGLAVDGKLVITEATATLIIANLIQGGILMSKNGSSWLNMDNGTFNFQDKLIGDNTGNLTANKLTVIRPDGVKWVENGLARFDFGAEGCEPPFTESPIEIQQAFWRLGGANGGSGVYKKAQYYTMKHVGRYLKATFVKGMMIEGSGGNVQLIRPDGTVLANNFFNNLTTDSANNTVTLTADLGTPTFGTIGFYVEMRVSSSSNATYVRKLRIWQEG